MAIKINGTTVIDVVGGTFKGTFKTATTQSVSAATLSSLTGETGEVYFDTNANALAAWNGSSWVSM